MSTGAGAMLQGPYVLQAGYLRVQVPQFPSQFMPMRAGVGMGIYGMSCSTAPPMMPFPLASPCQSTLAASGMAMVDPMHQLQLPLNPFQPLPSADFWFHFDSCSNIFYKLSFDVSLYRSSRNQFTHVPLMSKELTASGSSAIVLPSQIITPAFSSSTSVLAEVPRIPEEGDESGSSQRI